MGELFDRLAMSSPGDERKALVARYIYNEARTPDRIKDPMLLELYYAQYESLLAIAKELGSPAKDNAPMEAEAVPERSLAATVKELNVRLKGSVSNQYDQAVIDQIWAPLLEDAQFSKKLGSESRNRMGRLNLSVYAKVVGRLCYHGIISGRNTTLSKVLFGELADCSEDTLRREISAGFSMELPSDEVIKSAVDRVVRPLRV